MSTAETRTMTSEEYHASNESISNSSKEVFRRDRLAYYAQYVTGSMPKPEQTESQWLGECVHTCLLEPERWVNEFIVPPKFDRRTTVGKQGFAAFASENAGKKFVEADVMATVKIVREAAFANREIRKLLERDGEREHTISWLCPDTWLPLKSRRDLVFSDGLYDLKTCEKLTQESFAKAIVNWGYHRQAAFYMAGEHAYSDELKPFTFIALCTKQPYGVGLFTVKDDWLRLAYLQNQTILKELRRCRDNPELFHPDYTRGAVALDLPEYAQWQIELED